MNNNSQVNKESNLSPDTQRTPVSVLAAWAWFLVLAAVWILLGILNLLMMRAGGTVSPATTWIVSILMFAAAFAFVWIGSGIRKQRRLFYFIAIAFLVFIIILTVLDQFGVSDFIALIMHLGLLVLLLATGRKYTSAQPGSTGVL